MLFEYDILINWSIFSSVIILIWIFITCNSWINSLNEYGILKRLKERPNLLTFLILIEPSGFVWNFIGPSE